MNTDVNTDLDTEMDMDMDTEISMVMGMVIGIFYQFFLLRNFVCHNIIIMRNRNITMLYNYISVLMHNYS
jgi:hypothetical protein